LKAPVNDPPTREEVFDRLMETVAEAVFFAVSGDAGGGHRRLTTALRRAQKAYQRKEPWSEESVAYYRHVIQRYEERFFTGAPHDTDPSPAKGKTS
jgi:hypothetical protein